METVQIKGLAEIGRALQAFGPTLGKKYLRRATYSAAVVIEQEAINRAPVKTGLLKQSIAIFKRKMDNEHAAYAIGVRKLKFNRKETRIVRVLRKLNGGKDLRFAGEAYYAKFLELGTSKMSARPFMRPAFETQKNAAVEAFKTVLADGVAAAASEIRNG